MAKRSTINKNRYDKIHMKQFLLKYHIVNDSDIISKLETVPSKQDYIRQLIRKDIAGSAPDSVPDSESVPETKTST